MEFQMDFSRLERIAQSESPIIGIPRPGEAPFAFRRKMLAQLIEGMPSDTTVTVNGFLEIKCQTRGYKLTSLDMSNVYYNNNFKELKRWSEKLLDKMTAPKRSKADSQKASLLKRIGIEERKAEKINPGDGKHLFNLDYDGGYFLQHYRGELKTWKEQKSMRRKIGRIAAAHGLKHGSIVWGGMLGHPIPNPGKLYRSLQELTGNEPRKYGSLHESRHISRPDDRDYLAHIYQYCGFIQKPFILTKHARNDWYSRDKTGERKAFCAKVREYKNQLAYVQYLKDQLASFDNQA